MSDANNGAGGFLPVSVSDITRHLGTIKNELFIFVLLVILITDGFAYALVHETDTRLKYCGVGMGGSTVLMFFISVTFYFYATLKLPSSKQELMFEDSTKENLKSHTRAQENVDLNPS
jgi:hypothetical protein